jgi:hypothetical protein
MRAGAHRGVHMRSPDTPTETPTSTSTHGRCTTRVPRTRERDMRARRGSKGKTEREGKQSSTAGRASIPASFSALFHIASAGKDARSPFPSQRQRVYKGRAVRPIRSDPIQRTDGETGCSGLGLADSAPCAICQRLSLHSQMAIIDLK